MPAKLYSIHPKNPEARKIEEVVSVLERGGIIIYPTDTVYGIGCSLLNKKSIKRLCQILQEGPLKIDLSFICHSISDISSYVRKIEKNEYKILKQLLPGPFTFIFQARPSVSKIMEVTKTTVGIRIPKHAIPMAIVEQLGKPLITKSAKKNDAGESEHLTDPAEMYEIFKHLADIVIDGGPGGSVPSTVVDFTSGTPQVTRQGLGIFEY